MPTCMVPGSCSKPSPINTSPFLSINQAQLYFRIARRLAAWLGFREHSVCYGAGAFGRTLRRF
jgi:hypothetical protein